MASLGYRLSDATLGAMMMSYDADRTGNLGFDEYLQAMSELTLFTNLFRTHDTSSTGGEREGGGAHWRRPRASEAPLPSCHSAAPSAVRPSPCRCAQL